MDRIGPVRWSGYDELDTKLKVKGVQDGPKKKAMRQAFEASAAKVVLSGETTVKDLSDELGIKDSTLGRWTCECEEMGDGAFPRNGSPKVNKDHEIVKPEKKVEELERENGILNNFRASLSQGHVRGSSSSKGIGAGSAPSRRHAGRWKPRDPVSTSISAGRSPTLR